MAALVDTISPGRGRPGDLVTIAGSGFSPTFGQNAVTFDGVLAGINVNGEEELQVVVPLGISVDQHVDVVVTNLDDASEATWYWWSKDTVSNTAAQVLRTKIPWIDEIVRGLGRDVANMGTAEARYFERIATKIELVRDLLAAKGDFFSRGEIGLRQAPAGVAGQEFVSGVFGPGGQFRDRQAWQAQFGLLMTSSTLSANMAVGATQDQGSGDSNDSQVIPEDGLLALATFREGASATSRINRVEILLDGVVQFDAVAGEHPDFPGLGLQVGDHVTLFPGLEVTAGQEVNVRLSRNNTTSLTRTLGYLVVR